MKNLYSGAQANFSLPTARQSTRPTQASKQMPLRQTLFKLHQSAQARPYPARPLALQMSRQPFWGIDATNARLGAERAAALQASAVSPASAPRSPLSQGSHSRQRQVHCHSHGQILSEVSGKVSAAGRHSAAPRAISPHWIFLADDVNGSAQGLSKTIAINCPKERR